MGLDWKAEPKAQSLHHCDGIVQGFQRELEEAPSLLCAVSSRTSSLQTLKPLLLLLPLLSLRPQLLPGIFQEAFRSPFPGVLSLICLPISSDWVALQRDGPKGCISSTGPEHWPDVSWKYG